MVKKEQHDCCDYMVEMRATPDAPYHFQDVGLPNVFLTGIRFYVCSGCKRIVKAEIPAVNELLDAIARAVVTKPSPLTGAEVRYLRKRLGIKASEFADIIDVSAEQLSRWENQHNGMGGATDRLIRIAYAFIKKDSKLKSLVQQVQEKFQQWSTSIHKSPTGERIHAEYKANRKWIAEAEAIAA